MTILTNRVFNAYFIEKVNKHREFVQAGVSGTHASPTKFPYHPFLPSRKGLRKNEVVMEIFEALLESPSGTQGIYITVPFLVVEVFGSQAHLNVRGTINGLPYISSIALTVNGTHVMKVSREQLAEMGKRTGDVVEVTMEIADERARNTRQTPPRKKVAAAQKFR
jgi:hypothetical protein